jgi:channel protein (hemolysin III family)
MPLKSFLGLHEPVSSLTHLFAAASSAVASIPLLRKGWDRRGPHTTAFIVFSLSLLLLFVASGVYHAQPPGPWRALLRRVDYAAIWLLIAGTATPVHVLLLKGHWRWGLTMMFWTVGAACLVLIDVYYDRIPYWGIVSTYIGYSLLGLISYVRIVSHYGWREPTLLCVGGAAYIVGAVIDSLGVPVLIPGVLGPHEIFHLLVIVGAATHWSFVYSRAEREIGGAEQA